eukprot:6203264-Pleurochrysis_carterae.AAC.4
MSFGQICRDASARMRAWVRACCPSACARAARRRARVLPVGVRACSAHTRHAERGALMRMMDASQITHGGMVHTVGRANVIAGNGRKAGSSPRITCSSPPEISSTRIGHAIHPGKRLCSAVCSEKLKAMRLLTDEDRPRRNLTQEMKSRICGLLRHTARVQFQIVAVGVGNPNPPRASTLLRLEERARRCSATASRGRAKQEGNSAR